MNHFYYFLETLPFEMAMNSLNSISSKQEIVYFVPYLMPTNQLFNKNHWRKNKINFQLSWTVLSIQTKKVNPVHNIQVTFYFPENPTLIKIQINVNIIKSHLFLKRCIKYLTQIMYSQVEHLVRKYLGVL